VFLTVIAILPDLLLFQLKVPPRIAYFFGGTGMLITVGVILDTMRQIETFLLQRHYDGFLKKGRIRGRSNSSSVALGEAASDKAVMQLTAFMVVMMLVGLAAWLIRHNLK
jgi:preprotein translocase subunit SecY